MSAFIVSYNHINEICNYIYQRSRWEKRTTEDMNRIGRMLWAENYRSVNHRYNESEIESLYVFRLQANTVSPLQFIKLLHCLDYQSCEHDEWESSEAYKLVHEWIDNAVHDLPGYDDLKWAV